MVASLSCREPMSFAMLAPISTLQSQPRLFRTISEMSCGPSALTRMPFVRLMAMAPGLVTPRSCLHTACANWCGTQKMRMSASRTASCGQQNKMQTLISNPRPQVLDPETLYPRRLECRTLGNSIHRCGWYLSREGCVYQGERCLRCGLCIRGLYRLRCLHCRRRSDRFSKVRDEPDLGVCGNL